MINQEEIYITSNLNKILDRLEQIRELSLDVKYSEIDLGDEIDNDLSRLESTIRHELEIREQALIKAYPKD